MTDDWRTFSDALGESKGPAFNLLCYAVRELQTPSLFERADPDPDTVVDKALAKAQSRSRPVHAALRSADRNVLLAGARHALRRADG